MTYIVNWTKTGTPPSGKPAITLPPLTVDSTSTSLRLTGKGTPNYGEIQQENFVRLLENFAGDIAPANPTVGQLWYDTHLDALYVYTTEEKWSRTDDCFRGPTVPSTTLLENGNLWWNTTLNALYVWYGTAWSQVWPALMEIPVAGAEEYNKLVDLYNTVVGPATGSTFATAYGYGQPVLAHTTKEALTNPLWQNLLLDFKKILRHQGTPLTGLTTRGFIIDNSTSRGIVTALAEYNYAYGVFSLIDDHRWQVSPLSLENAVLPNSSFTRTGSYFNAKGHNVEFTFASLDAAKVFFNTGGKMKFNFSFSKSQSTVFSSAWQTFISSIGTVEFNAEQTFDSGSRFFGFYDISVGSPSYTTIFNKVSTVPGSTGAYVKIEARIELVPSSPNVRLRFMITFAPDGMNNVYNGAYNSSNSAAIGSTTSSITTFKVSEVYLDGTPIAYPTAVQTGSFLDSASI